MRLLPSLAHQISRAADIVEARGAAHAAYLTLCDSLRRTLADTLTAQVFNRLFTSWDPDVMVDTHTSNGADYPYTMTLIHTQADKLGGALGGFLRDTMLPHMFAEMGRRGWPTCPYVNPVKDSPDHGIAEFLETPRFSTGFAALRWPMPISRHQSFANGIASVSAPCASIIFSATGNCIIAAACRCRRRKRWRP